MRAQVVVCVVLAVSTPKRTLVIYLVKISAPRQLDWSSIQSKSGSRVQISAIFKYLLNSDYSLFLNYSLVSVLDRIYFFICNHLMVNV